MPDDTETPQPEAAPDVQAPDDPLESPPAETPESPAAEPQNQQQYETEKSHAEAYTRELNATVERHRSINQDNMNQMSMELQKLKEMEAEPDPERPVPYALPAGPSGQQRNQLGPLIANVLKFGGLMAIAGMAGRGRGAVGTAALAGAIRGWSEGRNNRRDGMLGLYERQREAIKQLNKEQNDRYKELVANKKLKFQQMFQVLREEAARVGNYRMINAAERQDLKAVNDAIKAEDKINSDWIKQTRKDRTDWWKIMGKNALEYRDWVREQGGPSITPKTSDDDMDKIEEQYPWSKFLEHEKEQATKADIEKKKQEMKEGVVKPPSESSLAPESDDPYNLGDVK